ASALYTTNEGRSTYDGLQFEFRRRMSRGLLVTASYSFTRSAETTFTSIHQPLIWTDQDSGVPHSGKLSFAWNIPFGSGLAYGNGAPGWIKALAGNWSVSAGSHVQSGNLLSLSGIRLVGMSDKDLQKAFKIRVDK